MAPHTVVAGEREEPAKTSLERTQREDVSRTRSQAAGVAEAPHLSDPDKLVLLLVPL